jgi:hypothetical protein
MPLLSMLNNHPSYDDSIHDLRAFVRTNNAIPETKPQVDTSDLKKFKALLFSGPIYILPAQ